MKQKPSHLCSRAIVYLIGIMILMFGTTLSVRSDLGTTCAASLGQNIALLTGVSLGNVLFFVNLSFVVIQLILTREHNYLQILLQIPVNLLSSRLVDVFMVWIGTWPGDLLWRWGMLLFSIPCIAFGAVCTIAPNLPPTAPDGLAQTVSRRFQWKLSNTKNALDICQVIFASLLFLISKGSLGSVHVGTVLSALLIGRFVGLFMKYAVPRFPFAKKAKEPCS